MTWTSYRNRGEILRTVIATADARRDGLLPWDVEGVAESFGDKERRQVMTRSTNAFRVLIKTLLHAGIITDRTKDVYARFVDMAELAREPGDESVGDEVAALAMDELRDINRNRVKIGATAKPLPTA